METSEYLTIVVIAVSMVLSVLGLFFGIMLRAKGPYRTEWTDVPIEQQLQDGEFRWPKGIRTPRVLLMQSYFWVTNRNRICEIKKKRELRELPSLEIVADAKVIGANSHFDPDWSWIDADSFLHIGNE